MKLLTHFLTIDGIKKISFEPSAGVKAEFVVAWHTKRRGKLQMAAYWTDEFDEVIREELINILSRFARHRLGVSDIKNVDFFVRRRGNVLVRGNFKIIGAHRSTGDLFPITFLPGRFWACERIAFEHLRTDPGVCDAEH